MSRYFLGFAIIAALALGARAQALPAQPAQDQPAQDQPAQETTRDQETAAQTRNDRNCLRDTGSRIAVRDHDRHGRPRRDCKPGPGRVYDREELMRTGETDIGEALERLDPSIQSDRR